MNDSTPKYTRHGLNRPDSSWYDCYPSDPVDQDRLVNLMLAMSVSNDFVRRQLTEEEAEMYSQPFSSDWYHHDSEVGRYLRLTRSSPDRDKLDILTRIGVQRLREHAKNWAAYYREDEEMVSALEDALFND